MSNSLLTDINASGIFRLRAPFDDLLPTQTTLTVKGVRKLSEIIASGIDPYEKYYEPQGISEAIYDLDFLADVSIISLTSGSGQWLYVPSTSIISYPNVNGVSYTSMILGVSLGSLADTTLLDALKTSITNVVKDALGVTPDIKEIAASASAIVSHDDHVLIENARSVIKVTNKSDRALLLQSQIALTAATTRIQELETYIKTQILPL